MSSNDAMRVSDEDAEEEEEQSSSVRNSGTHSPAEPSSSSGWTAFLAKETRAQAAGAGGATQAATGQPVLLTAVATEYNNSNNNSHAASVQTNTNAATPADTTAASAKVKLSFGLPAFALPQAHISAKPPPLPPATTTSTTATSPGEAARSAPTHVPGPASSSLAITSTAGKVTNNNNTQSVQEAPAAVPQSHLAAKQAAAERNASTQDLDADKPTHERQLYDEDGNVNEPLLRQLDELYKTRLAKAPAQGSADRFDVPVLTQLLQLARQTVTSDAVTCQVDADASANEPLTSSTSVRADAKDSTQEADADVTDAFRTAMFARLGLQKATVEEWSWTGVTASLSVSAKEDSSASPRQSSVRNTSEWRSCYSTIVPSMTRADVMGSYEDEGSVTEDEAAACDMALPTDVLTMMQLEQRQRKSDEPQHEQLSDILRSAK